MKLYMMIASLIFISSCKNAPANISKLHHRELTNLSVSFGRHTSVDPDGSSDKDSHFTTLLVSDHMPKEEKSQGTVVDAFSPAFLLLD